VPAAAAAAAMGMAGAPAATAAADMHCAVLLNSVAAYAAGALRNHSSLPPVYHSYKHHSSPHVAARNGCTAIAPTRSILKMVQACLQASNIYNPSSPRVAEGDGGVVDAPTCPKLKCVQS
jgi:hypothetical protein